VHDTIGFIRELPPDLIEAFRSTLEDSIESDVLLHVIDAGDPRIEEKLETVENILSEIGATQRRIHVFNKSDTLSEREIVLYREKYALLDPVFVSSSERTGIDELKARMYRALPEFL
jgi:GTPase